MARSVVKEMMDLLNHNRDGAYATKAARQAVLVRAAKDLRNAGFRDLTVNNLKTKHVSYMFDKWKAEGLAAATLKNRAAHFRWWAEKIGKQNVVPRTNSALGIDRRVFVAKETKALVIHPVDLTKIVNEHVRCSIELQRAFGLRREECLKFQPGFALRGQGIADTKDIALKGSWCKGGRDRTIPITNDYQREVLARAAALAKSGSMIPPNLKYIDQVQKYNWAVEKAGLSKLHGLRHEYAQSRYLELTGWKAPVAGGPNSKEMTPAQREIDKLVRLQVSNELGHGREAITAVYLGR